VTVISAIPARRALLPPLPWRALVVFVLVFVGPLLPEALGRYPQAWELPIGPAIDSAITWLQGTAAAGAAPVGEAGFLHSLAAAVSLPFSALEVVLASGATLARHAVLPPLPWFALVLAAGVLAQGLGGRRDAVLATTGLLLLAVTGHWVAAMTTLAGLVAAVVIGTAAGVAVGVAVHRAAALRRWARTVLDILEAAPPFAFLVATVALAGAGAGAAQAAATLVATLVMARATLLGLDAVPPAFVELGRLSGCTERQLLVRILLPQSRPALAGSLATALLGALTMLVLGDLVGAPGLGSMLMDGLRRMEIGSALEGALVVAVLAALCHLVARRIGERVRLSMERPLPSLRPALLVAAATLAVGWAVALLHPGLATVPEGLTLSLAGPIGAAVAGISHLGQLPADGSALEAMLGPVRSYVLAIPWFALPIVAALAGAAAGGRGLSARLAVATVFIVVAGLHRPAMTTLFIVGGGVAIALLAAVPLGVAAAHHRRIGRWVAGGADALKALPVPLLLLPAVALFGVGEAAAMLSIAFLSVLPAADRVDRALRAVPAALSEAGAMSGCTWGQRLVRIGLPIALPDALLGLAHVVSGALAILAIAALIGTYDLGFASYRALVEAKTGDGIVAGLAFALVAVAIDRLLVGCSAQRRLALGGAA